MGMFPDADSKNSGNSTKQKDLYKRSSKEDFEEVMDYLEEPQYDPEEMQKIAWQLR